MRDRDFKHFRDESGWFLKKLGIPTVARVIKVDRNKKTGYPYLYQVTENIYLVDEEKRVVYTNDPAVRDSVCYAVPYSNTPVCIPENASIVTDPEKYNGRPLERNPFEEAIIATEEAVDDDTVLGHFAYYCVTRGGVPVLGYDKDGGSVMVCVGGNVDDYSVKLNFEGEATATLRKVFKNPERALTIFYIGGEYGEVFGKRRKVIVPQMTAQKAGVVFSVRD